MTSPKQIQARQARQKQLQFTNLQYAILLDMEKTIPNASDLTKDTQELVIQLQPYRFKGLQYQQTAKKLFFEGKDLTIIFRVNLYFEQKERRDKVCDELIEARKRQPREQRHFIVVS